MRLSLALALMVLTTPGTLLADDDTDQDEAPGTVAKEDVAKEDVAKENMKIGDETLELAYQGADDNAAIKEYIPKGQKLENWTKLAAVRVQTVIDDPEAYAEGMIEELKKENPDAQYELLNNEKTGEVILDFTVWAPDKSVVEFNVFQYRKHAGGGLVSHQYALRAYGDDAKDFVASLDEEKRVELIAAVVGTDWPTIEKDDDDGDDNGDDD